MVTLDRHDAESPGHVRPDVGEAELGCLFLPDAWGRGYGAEACVAALDWFVDALPKHGRLDRCPPEPLVELRPPGRQMNRRPGAANRTAVLGLPPVLNVEDPVVEPEGAGRADYGPLKREGMGTCRRSAPCSLHCVGLP
jgi:hypothetical protein